MSEPIVPTQPTGAQAIVGELVAHGVTDFFANPGTSEIHLVAAIDATPGARAVLCLFEGVATGAADGYARACGKPAAVLLHLGPGLANGLANLHNAMKARSPMLVLVGDHAIDHLALDTPLRSDIDALAGFASKAVIRLTPGEDPRQFVRKAVAVATRAPAGPVVLIVSADLMWNSASPSAAAAPAPADDVARVPSEPLVDEAARLLETGGKSMLLLGGEALSPRGLLWADRIGQHTGCSLYAETFNARHYRGAGLPAVERLPYFQEALQERLADVRTLLLVGSRPPAAFFASPGRSGEVVPPTTRVLQCPEVQDPADFLPALAARLGANAEPRRVERQVLPDPAGPIDAKGVWAVINRHLPAGAIVSDEAGVTSLGSDAAMQCAPEHLWLNLTGGSIGQGLPVALGAAVANAGTPVVAVQGDGGAMYTLQALWSAAREGVRLTSIIFKNRRYGILDYEAKRLGLTPLGPSGASMFDLSRPDLSWVALAKGMGLQGVSVSSAEEFATAFAAAVARDEPGLIEVVLARRH